VPPLAGTKITGEKVSEPARKRPWDLDTSVLINARQQVGAYYRPWMGENQSTGIEKIICMDSLPLVVRNCNKYVRPISFEQLLLLFKCSYEGLHKIFTGFFLRNIYAETKIRTLTLK
jgi:hypothetical protein